MCIPDTVQQGSDACYLIIKIKKNQMKNVFITQMCWILIEITRYIKIMMIKMYPKDNNYYIKYVDDSFTGVGCVDPLVSAVDPIFSNQYPCYLLFFKCAHLSVVPHW